MAAIDTLVAKLRRDLRDTGTSDGYDRAFTNQELVDLVDLALAEVSRAYPRELSTTVAIPQEFSSKHSTSISLPTGFDTIYRIDCLDYRIDTTVSPIREWYDLVDRLDPSMGEGPAGGWEIHAGLVYLQPSRFNSLTSHLRIMGYGNWTVDTLDADAEQAVRYYVQSEGMYKLLTDRSMFQQWQVNPGNSDVTVPAANQIYTVARGRYERLIGRLRKLKKVG
jgi:hypothetical protein